MLFVGFMISSSGTLNVLEYNVRFGDPETQSLLALMSPTCDLAEILLACIERRLDFCKLEMQPNSAAVTVVLASEGYPGSYKKGIPMKLGQAPEGVTFFHAGTSVKDSQLVTSGGRVLGVTAVAADLRKAVDLAYKAVDLVEFEGKTFRKDIAHR